MQAAFLLLDGTSLSGLRKLILAQEPCEAKSNEITAIPRLLERMVLEGAVVTIDAVGCQRAIVQDLRAASTYYVLAVKRNQPTLQAAVQDHCETVERNGGRRERRPARCWAVPVSASGWRILPRGPVCTT